MTQPKIVLGSVGPNVKAVLKTDQGKVLEAKLSVGLPGKGGVVQYQANGVNVGTPATIKALNFTGDGVSGSASGDTASIAFTYSGQYKGAWDMSSGTAGPAAPATDYQATHTGTTITPAAHLTSGQPFAFATATSARIPILTSGTAQASIINPGYVSGDTIYTTSLFIANSAITAQGIETFLNGTPVSGVWLAGVSIAGFLGKVQLFDWNDGAGDSPAFVDTAHGDTLLLNLDYATGAVTLTIGSNTYGPATLNLGDIPAGQGLHLIAGVISTSADVVFDAGHISVNFSDTSGGGAGFRFAVDATLPVGALDNDWYEVSGGGYFKGKTTRAGQFAKLISGKTNLIVVPKPADPGTSAVESVTVTHFADINTTGVTDPRLFVVTADETNANQRTQYLYDGAALMWLVAVEA